MIVHELPGNIIYIENAFPNSKEFIDMVEAADLDETTHPVMPKWEDWHDSKPKNLDENNPTKWERIIDDYTKGKQKLFNWDISKNIKNTFWPRLEHVFTDEAHLKAEPIINLIHEPYLKLLDIWYEKTGNSKLEYISKNYFLRKYNVGGMIGPHIDKNKDNPLNTMDWSVLFYLNDNYQGGEIVFPELDINIKPSAGSAIFFPCTAVHIAKPVESGQKYYIFMVIHSEFNYTSGLGEPYHQLNTEILRYRGVKNHILLDLEKLNSSDN